MPEQSNVHLLSPEKLKEYTSLRDAYHKKKDYREELRQSHLEVLKRGKR